MFERQITATAFSLARESAGKSMDARMAMMAITTSNSISVKRYLTLGSSRRDRIGLPVLTAVEGSLLKGSSATVSLHCLVCITGLEIRCWK